MGFNHSAQLSLLALGGSISSLLGAIGDIKQQEASRARQEATNKWRTEYARIQEQKAQNDTKRLELRERAVQVNEKLADLQAQKTEAYINKANADTRLKDAKAAKLEQQVKANKVKMKKAKTDTKGETTIKKTPKVEAMEQIKEKYQKINKSFEAPQAEFDTRFNDRLTADDPKSYQQRAEMHHMNAKYNKQQGVDPKIIKQSKDEFKKALSAAINNYDKEDLKKALKEYEHLPGQKELLADLTKNAEELKAAKAAGDTKKVDVISAQQKLLLSDWLDRPETEEFYKVWDTNPTGEIDPAYTKEK